MRFVWWLATILAVSLVSIFLSERGATDPVRNLSLTVTSPVQGGLRDIASPINDIFSGITDRDLTQENEQLRNQLEQLKAQLAKQQDVQQRLQELQDAVGVKQKRPDDSLTAANVIAEDTSGLKRFIAIDMGEGDGLKEGMVVLSRNGSLIGTIARIYQDFAWIRLITDPDSAVNAQVSAAPISVAPVAAAPQVATPATPTPQASSTPPPAAPSATPAPPTGDAPNAVRAVAKGDLRRGVEMDLIPSEAVMARGDLIVTSGHGGNYPRGLLLGSVKDVDERPQAPFKTATIQPAADLSKLDTVLILTSFMPARLTSP